MSTEGLQMSLLDYVAERTRELPDGSVCVYCARSGGWVTMHPADDVTREILLRRSREEYHDGHPIP